MEFEHHNLSKSEVRRWEVESGKSANPIDVGKNIAVSAKECTLSDFNSNGMDLECAESTEQSSIKIGSPAEEVKELAQNDLEKSVTCEAELEKSGILPLLSCSVGSYGNESSELVLLDFSVSEIGEADSENATEVHSNLETLESITKTEEKPAEVPLSGPSSTPSKICVFSRRSSIFKQFDPLRLAALQKCSGHSSTEKISLLMGGNGFLPINNSSNDVSDPFEVQGDGFLDDSLIYFDSATPLTPRVLFPSCTVSPRRYTEDYVQKALKDQESRLTREYMKRYIRREFKFIEQSSARKHALLNKVKMSKCVSVIVSEMLNVRESLNSRCEELEVKIKSVKEECALLESYKSMCKEDLNERENVFSESHRRYEQSKNMLETYKKNHSAMTDHIAYMQSCLDEQSKINSVLESRMKRITEMAEKEVEFAKKLSETKITVLEAQVKKAQMTICSLESTLEQAQLENTEFVSIYDDLMSKLNA